MQTYKYDWPQLINEQKASNLTVNEFCRQRELNVSSFHRWIHKLSSTGIKEDSKKEAKKESEQLAKTEYWRSLIEEYKVSSLGATKFCKQKKVGQTTFYRWKSRLEAEPKKEGQTKKAKAKWTEVVVPKKHPISKNIENKGLTEISVKVGEFTVHVPNHFDETTLISVCKALVSLC